LKGDDGDDADAEIDHGQAVLPAEGAGVQEAGPGGHDPYEGGRSERPCDVCAVVDEGLAGGGVDPVEASGWGAVSGGSDGGRGRYAPESYVMLTIRTSVQDRAQITVMWKKRGFIRETEFVSVCEGEFAEVKT
jgi:hypothetical protein